MNVNVNVNVRCVQPVGHVVRAALDPRGVRAAGGGRGAVGVRAARAGDHESGGPLVSARLGSAPPEGLLRPQLRVRRASVFSSSSPLLSSVLSPQAQNTFSRDYSPCDSSALLLSSQSYVRTS